MNAPCGCDSVLFHRPGCRLLILSFEPKEAEVLREFLRGLKGTLAAMLTEAPRPSPDVPYRRRLTDEEREAFWRKLFHEPWDDDDA